MNNTAVALNDTGFADNPFDEQEGALSLEILLKYTFVIAKLLSDIFIIHCMRKFQILKTWENSLIMHWAIVDLAHLLLYQLYSQLLLPSKILRLVPCIVDSIVSTSFLSTLIFGEAILVAFVVLNSRCSILDNRESLFKKFYIGCIYILCVLECIVEFTVCRFFENLMFTVNVIICLSVVLNFTLTKIIKCDGHVSQTYYVVYASNITIFSLVPLYIYHYLLIWFRSYESFEYFLEKTIIVAYLILLSNSLVILVLLYQCCRDFRTVVLSIVKKLLMRSEISWCEMQQEV